jgi:hypothetical protein
MSTEWKSSAAHFVAELQIMCDRTADSALSIKTVQRLFLNYQNG